MLTVLPIASGKGGVGKTLVCANLGASLAKNGKTVVVVDLDLGASNLHTVLGVKNNHYGISALINKKETKLENLIVETNIPKLFIIPGDTLIPGTANIDFFSKRKILKELLQLKADYVLLDLGAGSSYNVVDFFLSSSAGLMVIVPEITSVLNAYSFLKTCAYRLLYTSFPAKSDARKIIQAFVNEKIEGSSNNFISLVNTLVTHFPEQGLKAKMLLEALYPRIIMNMGSNEADMQMGVRLRDISKKNLGINIEYSGFLPRSSELARSINERHPLVYSDPSHQYSQVMAMIASRLIASPACPIQTLYPGEEDLEMIFNESKKFI